MTKLNLLEKWNIGTGLPISIHLRGRFEVRVGPDVKFAISDQAGKTDWVSKEIFYKPIEEISNHLDGVISSLVYRLLESVWSNVESEAVEQIALALAPFIDETRAESKEEKKDKTEAGDKNFFQEALDEQMELYKEEIKKQLNQTSFLYHMSDASGPATSPLSIEDIKESYPSAIKSGNEAPGIIGGISYIPNVTHPLYNNSSYHRHGVFYYPNQLCSSGCDFLSTLATENVPIKYNFGKIPIKYNFGKIPIKLSELKKW